MLNQLGYNAGSVDGHYGKKTEDALKKFYQTSNKEFDNKLAYNEIKDLKNLIFLYPCS